MTKLNKGDFFAIFCIIGTLIGVFTVFKIIRDGAANSWVEAYENCKLQAKNDRESVIGICENTKTKSGELKCSDVADVVFIIESRECDELLQKSEELRRAPF